MDSKEYSHMPEEVEDAKYAAMPDDVLDSLVGDVKQGYTELPPAKVQVVHQEGLGRGKAAWDNNSQVPLKERELNSALDAVKNRIVQKSVSQKCLPSSFNEIPDLDGLDLSATTNRGPTSPKSTLPGGNYSSAPLPSSASQLPNVARGPASSNNISSSGGSKRGGASAGTIPPESEMPLNYSRLPNSLSRPTSEAAASQSMSSSLYTRLPTAGADVAGSPPNGAGGAKSGAGTMYVPVEKESAGILKEGWLTKLGHDRPTWKMRWFVLRPGVIEYYTKQDKKVKKGFINLSSSSICKDVSAYDERAVDSSVHPPKAGKLKAVAQKNCFSLQGSLPAGGEGPKTRTYYAFAETPELCMEWVEAISKEIASCV